MPTISAIEKPRKECKTCNKKYTLNKKYSTKQTATSKYCSRICMLKKTRNQKEPKKKICIECSKDYFISTRYKYQYSTRKYCSRQCSANAKKIIDQYKNTDERNRRRKGAIKQKTPEWLDRIRSTTKDAMKKPDVQTKLHAKRMPLKETHKIELSNANVGKKPKNLKYPISSQSSFSHVQRGEYLCSKGVIFFRSGWEANYALYLDFLIKQSEIKDWQYEADMFWFEEIKRGTRTYTPDFKVFCKDGSIEYHEVKGYLTPRGKTQLKRMKKYYPDVKLILIDKYVYYDIKKKLGKVLNFY